VKCEMINKMSTVTKLGTCIVDVLCQYLVKYYTVKVFIIECNLSMKFKNHSFPDISNMHAHAQRIESNTVT
jgi:hypothetical protein